MNESNALAARIALLRERRTPHTRVLGLTITDGAPAEGWLTLPYQPLFVGDTASGAVHGGVVTTMLDDACGVAVQLAMPERSAIATLDLRIDYMRPATTGVALMAHAHCYKVTRTIAFARATVYQTDESDLIASAAATFMLGANRTDMLTEKPTHGLDFSSTMVDAVHREMVQGYGDHQSPYSRFLGITEQATADGLTTRMPFDPRLVGNPILPALHGGTLGAFLETTAMRQVQTELGVSISPKPIGLTINYLRSGRPVDTFARARITKQGRRVLNFEVHAWQDDPERPIAAGFGHFLLRHDKAR